MSLGLDRQLKLLKQTTDHADLWYKALTGVDGGWEVEAGFAQGVLDPPYCLPT